MNSIRCPQCNFLSFATATECKRCRFEFQPAEAGANQFQANHSEERHFDNYQNEQAYAPPDNSNNSNDFNNYQNYNHAGSGKRNNYNYQSAPPRYQTQSQKPKIKLAVISMILGILSFPGLSIIIGIILAMILGSIFGATGAIIGLVLPLATIPGGLITGIVSLMRAKKRPFEYGGKGFAIAGIVLSGMFMLVFPLIAAIAVPNLLAARRAANEAGAISSIRSIAGAENTYLTNRVLPENSCADLASLGSSGAINPALAAGTHNGYKFVLTMTATGCEINATPAVTDGLSSTGIRSFYAASSENWIIRASSIKGAPANILDAPIDNGFSPTQSGQYKGR